MSRRTKKRKLESEDQTIADGEQDNFFSDEIKDEMETMWEIPQIFHFLHLTRESLNIPQLSIYEIERMLLIPRASKQLANIMTCLLSSPITKAKLRKVPPMPYEFWTNILAHKTASWFKVYHARHKDAIKVLETIGVEPQFWNIFPDASLLHGKDFENLNFKQRVWLLKTVCDTIMHTRKTVQEDIAKQPWEDQFETTLGADRYGARYIYFPQFIPNDLRIYRHSLDNKILSTVRPFKPKQDTSSGANNLISARLNRYRKKKSQSHNSLSERSYRHMNRTEDKDLNSFKSNNDSATSSFISEDTNLSSTSTCSNNNNNNNINLESINGKRCRSLSKTSEESTLSNTRSSGYDTNTSNDNKFLDDDETSQKMFKGFSNTQDDNCNIGIINEMLDDLRSEIDEERRVNESESNIKDSCSRKSQENFVGSCKNTARLCVETLNAEKNESERSIDNLSSSSKTDDEKLIEIISAESSKLPANVHCKNISASDNISDNMSTSTSKSDDEKLSETKTNNSNISNNGKKNSLNKEITFNGSLRASSSKSASLNEKVKYEHFSQEKISSPIQIKLDEPSIQKRNLRKRAKLRSRYSTTQHSQESEAKTVKKEIKERTDLEEENTDYTSDRHSCTSETRVQEIMEDDLNDYITSDTNYNLRSSKYLKTDECKQHFNELLSDLSVSDFQLIVDSVEGLRDLISSFSVNNEESNNINDVEVIPLCEAKLVKNLTELLSSLEEKEIALKETTRKAKTKLQREWSNFKEGVEDQDSSGEGGLSSNWWVLGSQGCPLSTPGEATLQTLSQSALSSLGSQNQQPRPESEHQNAGKNTEQSYCESSSRENDEQQNNDEKSEVGEQGRKQAEEKEQKQECAQHGENETTSNDEDAEQQTRRVLRARGISSYTEQFYSDESNEEELEEWTDVEAVYAAPGASADTSTSHIGSKARNVDDWSEEEDSDQDWILPSSRKRKNKRPPTNRRLKSFQHKLQNIKKENTSQSNVASNVPHLISTKVGKNKIKDNSENRDLRTQISIDSVQVSSGNVASEQNSSADLKHIVSSTDAICKIETVGSVHSELDIKDEDPIYDSGVNHYSHNNYCTNPQQNYIAIKNDTNPINYYVMPQNLAVPVGIMPQTGTLMQSSSIASPIQQSYYVQSVPNYVIHNPGPNFLPTPQQQPPHFQQQAQMIVQPFNNSGYIPYMAATTQPQTEYTMIAPRPQMINPQQKSQDPVRCAPRTQNRLNHPNKYITPRQNLLQNTSVRSNCQRPANPKSIKSNVSQQRAPNAKTAPRQKIPQTPVESTNQKTTSLIVLSDSDDEIEMIITEKTTTNTAAEKEIPISAEKARAASRRSMNPQTKQKPTVTSNVIVSSTKDVIPPQIIERMNQGGISITPVRSIVPPATSNTNTQLVVVVNETGSHYALALPNGSKLILTPEQVAQIRASNGGKLIL